MKLYIPSLGDDLTLIKDWEFSIKREHADYSLLDYIYGPCPWWEESEQLQDEYIKIIKGTILRVDRIYIRKGSKDYDSITFRILKTKDRPGCRFWVPLEIANTIEFEIINEI